MASASYAVGVSEGVLQVKIPPMRQPDINHMEKVGHHARGVVTYTAPMRLSVAHHTGIA